jgi:hypothetical protein
MSADLPCATKPIFYTSCGGTRHNLLILLVPRGRWRENVVPRRCGILMESRRTGDRVRQQVIATLGRYEDLQLAANWNGCWGRARGSRSSRSSAA